MPGRHKFSASSAGFACCDHCGDTEAGLDAKRVNGQLEETSVGNECEYIEVI